MVEMVEGKKESKGKKYAVLVARWNDMVTGKLLEGALRGLRDGGVREEEISVAWVPGSFELASAAKKVADRKEAAAVICLGALIRGETPHFDYIARATADGITRAGMESGIPVIFGVLTTDTVEQALARAGGKMGNKGTEAAQAAIQMANLFDQI